MLDWVTGICTIDSRVKDKVMESGTRLLKQLWITDEIKKRKKNWNQLNQLKLHPTPDLLKKSGKFLIVFIVNFFLCMGWKILLVADFFFISCFVVQAVRTLLVVPIIVFFFFRIMHVFFNF